MLSTQEPQPKPDIPEFLSGGGELGQRIREFDWEHTPLGPVSEWPQSLRTCIRIMLTSRQPIWIGWGKELIKFYNDPYKAIVGGKHPWALGKPASLVWKDIWRDIGPMLQKVMEDDEGTYVESQLLIMERNGYPEETYYTFSYTPIPGDDGQTAGMICANSDDTDRIISERQLRTLTQLGKSLTDSKSNDEVIGSTIDVLKDNPHDFPFALFYTLHGTELQLQRTTDIGTAAASIPPAIDLNDKGPVAGLFREAIDSRRLVVLENLQDVVGIMPVGAWQVPPDKAVVLPIIQSSSKDIYGFLVFGLNPYRLLDEKYSSFFALIADQLITSFTNVHALEEERKRVEALAEIDRAKTAFFSNISHEFRTPLTLLLGPIEDVLGDPSTQAENKHRMQVAHRNVLRMQKLVNTLLEFSRIEAGRVEGRFSRVDIARITEDLASTFRAAIEKAGMQLEVRSGIITDDVYADVDMWEKVILNLVSNAFKYSKEGTIRVDIAQEGSNVKISVSDSGIGIPADHLDKIFNRFHRVENTEGRSQEGTGIGLAMVKELVKLHDGTISVSSTQGKGSTFTVTLPVGKLHLPKDRVVEQSASLEKGTAAAYVTEAMKWVPGEASTISQGSDSVKPTVLLADDNADMREYVERLLSEQFRIVTAVDGEDAYNKMLQYRPELLLSDIMMPRLSGFDLLKKVRAHPEIKHTPVIFLSARAGDESRVEGLDAGADDYMVKPFSARELIVRVSNHIRINQVRRETEQQFYQLFMQAPAIINVFKGPEYRYELFHPGNRAIFGNVDFTGMTLNEAIPELQGQGIFELLDQVYHEGKTVYQNERLVQFVNDKGVKTNRYFNLVYQPWYDIRGNIQGVLNFAIDVTETIESRKKIEESEQSLNELANAVPQLVWVADQNGDVTYYNNRISQYGGGVQRPDGKWDWAGLVHPEDREVTAEAWELAHRTGSTYQIEHRIQLKDGSYRWHLSRALCQGDENGRPIKWFGSATDIHAAKEQSNLLEQEVQKRTYELQALNVSLQQSNEDLQQFAHVASHDLKEPVRKIKTFTDRLEREYGSLLPDNGRLFLTKVQQATDRMYSMIDGVLTYSTLNASREPIASIDLVAIIRSIESDLEVAILDKDGTVSVAELPTIEGAPVLIHQLFYNLINNSLKFARADVAPLITIKGRIVEGDKQAFAEITVADNGIGFEPEYSRRIFDSFTRLNAKDKYEGTGLGLALCKKIVDRHHGQISAAGKEGEGATFTILLPIKQQQGSI